jgi:Na+-driven multidrug efflux pump
VQVAGHAVTFLRCRALACPALLSLYVATGSLRGHQDTRTPLQAALIANAVNLTLDIVLIFGLGLGVAGVRASAGSC